MSDAEKRPTGRVPGVRVPASKKTIAANRTRNWKHGGSAKTVTLAEATADKLRRQVHPDAPEILRAYTDILTDGNLDARKKLAAQAFTSQEIILRRSIESITEKGELLEESMVGPDGLPMGVKYRAHPLMDTVIRLNENLGYTAEAQELTPHSQKEGAKNVAAELAARHESRLLGALETIARRRAAVDPRLSAIPSEVVK